jgi:hypothetical protein
LNDVGELGGLNLDALAFKIRLDASLELVCIRTREKSNSEHTLSVAEA